MCRVNGGVNAFNHWLVSGDILPLSWYCHLFWEMILRLLTHLYENVRFETNCDCTIHIELHGIVTRVNSIWVWYKLCKIKTCKHASIKISCIFSSLHCLIYIIHKLCCQKCLCKTFITRPQCKSVIPMSPPSVGMLSLGLTYIMNQRRLTLYSNYE